jgi:hypothetical protein
MTKNHMFTEEEKIIKAVNVTDKNFFSRAGLKKRISS